MDYRLALMTGVKIPIQELSLVITQPTIKDISALGENEFFTALQYISIDKKQYIDDINILKNTSNFEIFVALLEENPEQRMYVIAFLNMIFPDNKIFLTPSSIIINKNENNVILDKDNFYILQEYLKDIFCLKNTANQQISFNPKGKKAKEIADKIMKGRQKILEEKGEDKESPLVKYLSILSVGNRYPLKELINLTLYQLYDLIERYSLYLNWDIDIRSRLAGAKGENKPENWMKNIH